ncbi:MAG: hypothetical protein ACRENS_03540 [Candidatus Eiseniibacteriota bacterium]
MKFQSARFAFSLAVLTLHLAAQWPSSAWAAGGPNRLFDPGMDMWSTGSRILISQALTNPAVQLAVRDFESRGYVRMPVYDASRSMGDTSAVFIAFQQPGVDMAKSMPMIVVFNTPGSFGTTVNLRGGLVERTPDGSIHGVANAAAPAIAVTDGGGLSTRATASSLRSGPGTNQQWIDWILCTLLKCGICSSFEFLPVIGQLVCCFIVAADCNSKIAVY